MRVAKSEEDPLQPQIVKSNSFRTGRQESAAPSGPKDKSEHCVRSKLKVVNLTKPWSTDDHKHTSAPFRHCFTVYVAS